jgi:hypothetical protein
MLADDHERQRSPRAPKGPERAGNEPLTADRYADAFPAQSDGRARVIAAGWAAASWVRARRATWDDVPPDLAESAADLHAPRGPDEAKPRLAFKHSATVPGNDAQRAFDHFATVIAAADHVVPSLVETSLMAPSLADSSLFETSRVREIAFAPAPSVEAESDAAFESPPVEPSHRVADAVAWARSLGGLLGPWLPRIGVAAVILTVTVTGWSYCSKSSPAPKTGSAVLESVPNGSQVLVDGKDVGTTPMTAALPVGPHTVEFRFKKSTRIVHVAIASGGRVVERVDWALKPTGRLRVTSEPAGARVLVDGAARGATPLTLDDLAVGAHAVVLQSAAGSVRRSVTVSADETTDVAETIFAGWLTILSPFQLEISEGTRAIRLDDRNQIMLKPGPHELRLENRALGFQEIRKVDVRPGETTALSIVPPRSALTVTATVPAEVWLDGVHLDHTPLVGFALELGTRELVVKNANGDERRFTLTVTAKPVVINADFSKP